MTSSRRAEICEPVSSRGEIAISMALLVAVEWHHHSATDLQSQCRHWRCGHDAGEREWVTQSDDGAARIHGEAIDHPAVAAAAGGRGDSGVNLRHRRVEGR